ncbi:STAS domain-containing protein [Hymenobacter properus]|uniref:STAS domain-containing protein n=1 Tax=Hymenobacter properus TaxID=2791026 RepID=A0A931BEN3_9BACT|nr:hypothetical protein [Hymenobacter properus]MBF9141156.1 hypothetical protein [Hymenobacter properus]MBR7719965.1 hypothetical protein [Microvirga sp. SRT04]
MTVVYHELLPESYLLILAPSHAEEPEAALAHSLHCAQRSGKAAVWVDCGMLHSLSDEAVRLLWVAHHQLEEKHAKLVLVHVPERVRRDLLKRELGPAPCIVPTLLDAARQMPHGIENTPD